jgi:hypothetical protein
LWRGRFREGLEDASFGTHPAFELAKCARRVLSRPYIVGSVARMSGYLWWTLSGRPPVLPPETVRFVRAEQVARLKNWRTARRAAR